MSKTKMKTSRSLASLALTDAYTDFILSRQAMNCTPVTMSFYRFTTGKFLEWIESQGLTDPQEISARHVRQFGAELTNRGLQDTTGHDYARAIRTLLRFWHAEKYIPQLITFDVPRLEKKRLLVLTTDELRQIVKACNVRDKAIVLFMANSGLRRSAVIGATTMRALLTYRRTLADREEVLFQVDRKAGALHQVVLFVSSND